MEKLYACLDENGIVIAIQTLKILEGDFYEGATMYIYIGTGSGFEDNQPTIGQIYNGLTYQFN